MHNWSIDVVYHRSPQPLRCHEGRSLAWVTCRQRCIELDLTLLQGGGGGSGFGSWRDFDWRDWGKRQGGSFLGSLKGLGQVLGAVLLFGLILAVGATPPCLQTSHEHTALFSSRAQSRTRHAGRKNIACIVSTLICWPFDLQSPKGRPPLESLYHWFASSLVWEAAADPGMRQVLSSAPLQGRSPLKPGWFKYFFYRLCASSDSPDLCTNSHAAPNSSVAALKWQQVCIVDVHANTFSM